MKKQLLSICVLLAAALTASAAEVDLATAWQKARQFMQQKGRQLLEQPVRPSWRRSADGGRDAGFYVFNASEQGGFVIVSADDATDDVLAWSDHGSFDYGRLPDNVQAWLDDYSRQLSLIRSGEATALRHAGLAAHDAVKPMLTTRWTQGSPFDDLCPMDISGRSATGCVATALGQIMKYHEWPKDSIPGIPGYTSRSLGFELDSLPPTKFDWASMQNVYPQTYYFQPPSEKETKAVAELMRYVGQSVQMDYAFGGSSGSYNDAARALKQYFGYDSDLMLLRADDYGLAEWEQMIYHELTTNGPVAYSGQSPAGDGHAFVIDGYEDQFYHVNWGWGGEIGPDGYYKLFLMNPQELGTGGGMSKEGFRLSQEAIVNFKPENGVKDSDYDRESVMLIPYGQRLVYQDGNIYFLFATNATTTTDFDYTFARITDEGYSPLKTVKADQKPMVLNMYRSAGMSADWLATNDPDVKSDLQQKGSSRITLIGKLATADEWLPVYDEETYFLLEKVNDTTMVVTPKLSDPTADIDVRATDFALEGTLLKGQNLRVSFRLGENTREFRGGVRVLVNSEDEHRYGVLDTKYVTLAPGDEDSFSGVFTAWRAGKYSVLAVLDDNPAKELGTYTFTVKEMANLTAGSIATTATDSTVWCQLPLTNHGETAYDRTLKARLYLADSLVREKVLTLALDSSQTANYEFLFDSLATATDYQLRFYIEPHPYQTTESEIASMTVSTLTSVGELTVSGAAGKTLYFDLNGRPVQAPSQRGLYIRQTARGTRKVVGGR